jgi:hypothetical protein
MTNPISIVINRPHGDPVRLRVKGSPTVMEDDSICVTCKDERNRTFWVSITPMMVRRMLQAGEAG